MTTGSSAVFEMPDFDNHERVLFASDAHVGLRAIIAVHDTALGPAIGGCRIWPYSATQDAVKDALRLSRGMSYKAAVANVPFGGGKAVIIADSKRDKSPALLHAVGRAIESLNGVYVTGDDVGTTPEDMAVIHDVTNHVMGLPLELGGSGNPSPSTALGCLVGVKAAVRHRLGRNHLDGVRVAIQGLGSVGYTLAKMLVAEGARLIVADARNEAVFAATDELDAVAVPPGEIFGVDADVFAPCALGGVLTPETIARLKASIVAGAANNQLADSSCSDILHRRHICYAPDFVINAGGMIQYALERLRSKEDPKDRIHAIAGTLTQIFEQSDAENISTHVLAERLARSRIASARH